MTNPSAGFKVDFASGCTVDLDEIRRRSSPFMPDGGHAWAINTVFALDDPEQAMDEMVLDEKNFVGVTEIYCLLCQVRYVTTNKFHKCPQKKADTSQ